MNTINYKDLKRWYIDNEEATALAKEVFGKQQPNIYHTGFYSSPSWNWGYVIGICGVNKDLEIKYYEVVTQFGAVVAAREIYVPAL